jgi:hypothetical protein
MWSPASDVVREGIDAMERGEIVYVTGRLNRFIKSALKLMPDKFALRAIQKRSNRFRRAD